MDFATNKFETGQISSSKLFTATGLKAGGLVDYWRQILKWLEAVAGSWHNFVPHEAVSLMVPEVVGNLAQAKFEVWDDVLAAEDTSA